MDCTHAEVCSKLSKALELRKKYSVIVPKADAQARRKRANVEVEFSFGADGVMHLRERSQNGVPGKELFKPPSLEEYYKDMEALFHIRSFGPVSSFANQRLRLLQTKFELYTMVSGDAEHQQVSGNGHRDFYNVRKVDTHVHHSAAMNAKHLLRFMKKKLKNAPDELVDPSGAKTVKDVFVSMGLSWTDLNIDKLEVWADKSCMHRFDRFNNKYSPIGQNDLRTIFLKTDNPMGGRYLAELTKELLEDLEESKYQHAEWRLSIYGRKRNEWENLSCWVLGENGKGLGGGRTLLSKNNKWMIQIPRLFSLYRSSKQLNNFGEMLENIFVPMFEATLNPDAHPNIARFLAEISGFDTVDDESKSQNPVDRLFSSKEFTPSQWDFADNPSYKYYSFFINANLRVLNYLREMKGMNQFSYRPHAGEAGEVHHLDTAFLLACGINHGLNLRKAPALQYLFYLDQVGVAMSPCSNNHLFLPYEKSPYPIYFARGLNVSLSTDDPLMFHQTKEPLMEEYSIAKQLWHFTGVDLCEMARYSVLQSGFDDGTKAKWLGTDDFWHDNDPAHTNVPQIRMAFRRRLHEEELRVVRGEAHTFQDDGTSMCEMLLLSPEARQAALDKNRHISANTSFVDLLANELAEEEVFEDEIIDDPKIPSLLKAEGTSASGVGLDQRAAALESQAAMARSPSMRSPTGRQARRVSTCGVSTTSVAEPLMELLRRPSFSAALASLSTPPWMTQAVSAAALVGALGGAFAAIVAVKLSQQR